MNGTRRVRREKLTKDMPGLLRVTDKNGMKAVKLMIGTIFLCMRLRGTSMPRKETGRKDK